MNTAVFVSFLRHLLFLFIALKLVSPSLLVVRLIGENFQVSGVIVVLKVEGCKNTFDDNEIVPFNAEAPRHAIFLSIDFLVALLNALGFLIIVMSCIAFVGAIYLHTYPLINFSAGLTFLMLAPSEMTAASVLHNLSVSFKRMIFDPMGVLFKTSSQINGTTLRSLKLKTAHEAPFRSGWSMAYQGNATNHYMIDYIQMNLKCCGLTGRQFWTTIVPRSCCSHHYAGDKCTLSVAYSRSCNYHFDLYDGCMNSLFVLMMCFSILALMTAIDSLYLARIKAKYPKGDYRSESSSESGGDEQGVA
ncbi:uncharacterized protein [Tenebrio molitor]|uniref:uncharacterized protein isoform X1 n=1 Tax=Tenebrio molitor TaxID=7067 RepID=UPI0036248121